jgi:hypothetical protein
MQSTTYEAGTASFAHDSHSLQQGYQQCRALINNRVQQETSYVKLTMLQQANNFTHTLSKEYMQTYFLENRFSRLLKKLVDQQTWLEIITRKMGEGTSVCSM